MHGNLIHLDEVSLYETPASPFWFLFTFPINDRAGNRIIHFTNTQRISVDCEKIPLKSFFFVRKSFFGGLWPAFAGIRDDEINR